MRESLLAAAAAVPLGCGDPSSNDTAANEASRAYIDEIVLHHQPGVAIADEGLTEGVHPGLKTLAQRVKDDQGREVGQFKGERTRLFGSDSTPPPSPVDSIPAGPVFDSVRLETFIEHHQTAINRSLLALDGELAGGDLTSLVASVARHTVDEQAREQQEFRTSITAWYGTP